MKYKLIGVVATSPVSEDESDNENDIENENENENENDAEADGDNENEDEDMEADPEAEGDVEGEGDQEQTTSPSTQKSSNRQPSTPPPRIRKREPPALQPRADTCSSYDIVPVLAAPHATSVNAITATTDMRWVFTGGSDGYIRKFDHFAGMNGKVPLTVAQKHPFVDSVTKVVQLATLVDCRPEYFYRIGRTKNLQVSIYLGLYLMEDDFSTPVKSSMNAPKISAVYCLAVHSEALWLLSGLEVSLLSISQLTTRVAVSISKQSVTKKAK
jgi:transcriptional activator SPT8